MIPITATITSTTITDPAATVDIFANVDGRGIASGSVTATPVNGARVPLFPEGSIIDGSEWLNRSWLKSGWLEALSPCSISQPLPPACFGLVKAAALAYDAVGNPQGGAETVVSVFVNSTPMPPAAFVRGAYAAGQQSFTFSESPQLRVA